MVSRIDVRIQRSIGGLCIEGGLLPAVVDCKMMIMIFRISFRKLEKNCKCDNKVYKIITIHKIILY